MNRVSLPVLLLLVLSGCTKICTDAGIDGSYELSVGGVPYILHFESGDGGTLVVAGKPVGGFQWKLVNAGSQQVLELNAEDEVFSALSAINPSAKHPGGARLVTQGAFEPSPHCKRDGKMQALVFSYDDGIEFLRMK